ncbi:hypothetical protein AB0M20_32705, partial [Actinoplanes sp. NPDC051633]|uniref:hypothetical protein n=1 Tax=Actinoplanes sp. NPDC051633 TaxID=3155670 RepID=UPI00343FE428
YTPVDLRWYGGVNQLGYSLVSQPVMATLGVRVTGVLALVASSVLLAVLLRRTGAPRPWAGALIGAACVAGNLVSGRVTYALGVAVGLGALVQLTSRRFSYLAAPIALLAAATSPVAGLFVGLAGAALLLTGRWREGLLLAVPAAIPVGLAALLFGDGGWMNISRADTVRAVVTSLIVAALVPRWPVRAGAGLSAAGVLAAALVHTPVGLNATRLVTMFALPLLAAYVTRKWLVVPLLVVTAVVQSPVMVRDLRDAGNPTADRAFFAPLREHLAGLRLTGRVEVPPTRDYWEAAHMGDVPLARGWLRQADIDRNPLFFTTVPGAPGTGVPLTADTYRQWLADKSVQYVAVPHAELSWPGRAEAALVTGGLPYLRQVWSSDDWRLYAVADPQPVVPGLVSQDAASLTFDASAAGDVIVRVRFHRWLRTTPRAVLEPAGEWTRVRAPSPGRYRLTS